MKESSEAMRDAWINYPSQDNEGYRPDRGGFKAGWASCQRWNDERIAALESALKVARDALEDISSRKLYPGVAEQMRDDARDALAEIKRMEGECSRD